MAYPSVTAPYGLLPINLIGGQVFAGATRQIPIASNSATAIFYGDVVKLASTGLLVQDTGTDAATPVGVLLGCSYTDPTFGKTFRQYYPGAVNASDIVAFVADDPDQLFKVAVVSGTTVVTYVNRTSVATTPCWFRTLVPRLLVTLRWLFWLPRLPPTRTPFASSTWCRKPLLRVIPVLSLK